jgi:hypothetical protein
LIGLIYPIIMVLVFYLISHLVGGSSTNLLIYNTGNSNLAQVGVQAFHNPMVNQAYSSGEVEAAFGTNGGQKRTLLRWG